MDEAEGTKKSADADGITCLPLDLDEVEGPIPNGWQSIGGSSRLIDQTSLANGLAQRHTTRIAEAGSSHDCFLCYHFVLLPTQLLRDEAFASRPH